MRALLLGGAGGIGQVAARALSVIGTFDRVVVADLREEAAAAVVAGLADPRFASRAVDAADAGSLAGAMADTDVVLNCVGPFYRFGPPILAAAIDAGVHYVDVCDDLAPTRAMLALDERARAKGLTAVVGLGNSPGLANLFVRLAADSFLDETHRVDIMHIHGGEPDEGPAVIAHRIRAMLDPVPLFLDGQFVEVMQLEESGAAHVVTTDFRHVGRFPVYPYPHPETITLPRHIPGLRRCTNLGVIFPLDYFALIQRMVREGRCDDAHLDEAVAEIRARRPRLLAEAGVTGPAGCLKVVVGGLRRGQARTLVLQLSSRSAGAGEGTGIPAAAGAALVARGQITRRGVFPPEAGVDPLALLATAFGAVQAMGLGGGDNVSVQQIDADGAVSDLPLPF